MPDSEGMTPEQVRAVEEVRAVMTGEFPGMASRRRRFRRFPSEPRCKLCAAPFGGVGGVTFRTAGYGRSPANPALCMKCETTLLRSGATGVEIPVTLLFSDVRGSTSMGERMRPTEFRAFLDHFYKLASDAITNHDGIVDKIVGDEVIGLFFGGISGTNHAGAAVSAAVDLAERAAQPGATPSGPIPAGTAVHTGDAFVGSSGQAGRVQDFTALGDVVNTTARLASAAGVGEVIISLAAVRASGSATDDAERRTLDIRGRTEPIEVVVLRPAEPKLSPSS